MYFHWRHYHGSRGQTNHWPGFLVICRGIPGAGGHHFSALHVCLLSKISMKMCQTEQMQIINELSTLLNNVGDAYEKSEIKRKQSMLNCSWGYSLITGSCVPKAPLIIGFNWGARAGQVYKCQQVITPSLLEIDDLGSLARVIPYIKEYFPGALLENMSQTNYCFFRSPKQSDISEGDLALCRPIFNRLIEVLKPSCVFCFSSKLRDYMKDTNQITHPQSSEIPFNRGLRSVKYVAIKGIICDGVHIGFFPHPNYPMPNHARQEVWEFCRQ
jgi:ribonuclease R